MVAALESGTLDVADLVPIPDADRLKGSSSVKLYQTHDLGQFFYAAVNWGRQAKDVVIKCTMPQEFDHSAQLTLALTFPCALSRFELNAIDLKISGAATAW